MKQTKKLATSLTVSKYFLYVLLIALPIIGFYIGASHQKKVDSINQITQQSNDTTNILPTDWTTYTNTTYGYKVDYPSNTNYEELDDLSYGDTSFLGSCFRIYSLPQATDLPQLLKLTRERLKELESLQEGTTQTYSFENEMGRNGFIYKETYKKLPSKLISGTSWSAFEITNNWENHGINTMYFTNQNNYLYLINMLSYGPCDDDEPNKMLSTFLFIN